MVRERPGELSDVVRGTLSSIMKSFDNGVA